MAARIIEELVEPGRRSPSDLQRRQLVIRRSSLPPVAPVAGRWSFDAALRTSTRCTATSHSSWASFGESRRSCPSS
jgi:hypothetical protein